MKIRLGFVSNSSSASYIVDLEKYPNVFSVAKAMLELIITNPEITLKEDDKDYARIELELLEQAIKNGVDPDLPLFIPGNYDTCIVKKEDCYDINTNFDHPFWKLTGFDGVDYFVYMDDPNMEYYFLYIGKYGTLNDYKTRYSELVGEKHKEIGNIVQNRKQRKDFQAKDVQQESVKRSFQSAEEFRINEYLTLKLKDKYPVIYVKGKEFRHCMRLVLNIPLEDIKEFEQIDSIDEASGIYDTLWFKKAYKTGQSIEISPQEEFWGHCSNLQTWAENEYDTRLIHSNLAFPLLKELYEAGDPVAKRVFKEEVVKRIESGYGPVILFLISKGYLNYLDKEITTELIKTTKISQNPKVQEIILGLALENNDIFLDLDLVEEDVYDIFSGFIELEMDNLIIEQYDLVEKNLLLLLRYILSEKKLREPFLSLLKDNLDKNYALVESLIDVLLSNSNKDELTVFFGENMSNIQYIFLEIVEKGGFEYYYEKEMWNLFGKSISGLVKEKIIKSVKDKNIDLFFRLYHYQLCDCLIKEDLISLFNCRETNLVEYLLENVTEEILYQQDIDGLYMDGIDDEVGNYISESIYKLLPNYDFKRYGDPLFTLGLFGYLNKKDIMSLIENPKIDYFKLLLSQMYAWEDSAYGRDYIKKSLDKVGVKFKEIVMPLIIKREPTIYFQFIDYWFWDLFDWEDIEELLNDEKLNFLNNLLVLCTKLASERKIKFQLSWEKRKNPDLPNVEDYKPTIQYDGYIFEDGLYLFPKSIPKEFLKDKIKEIFLSQNPEAFAPLYAVNCLNYFTEEEIVSMIKNKKFNLLIQVLDVLEKFDYELSTFRESVYEINENFFKIVRENVDASFILSILKAGKKLDISPLFNEGLIEKISYADLVNVIKDREVFSNFMKNLNKFIYYYESEMGYRYGKGLNYYENLWPYILKTQPECLYLDDLDLYLSLTPFLLIDIKFFEHMGVQFVIDLLEKADHKYIYNFFKDIRHLEMSVEVGSRNMRLIQEIYPFLHIVGNYFTPKIRQKILELLDIKLQKKLEDGKSSYSFKKNRIDMVYILFCLRWHHFLTKEEFVRFTQILRKNGALFNVIYQEFREKYGMSFVEYPVALILGNYYYFIDKEDVLSLIEKLPRKKKIKLLQWLRDLSDYIICPVNHYYRMAASEIRSNISHDYKVERKEKIIQKEPEIDLTHFFNQSIKVHELAEKPCHFIGGCPYGPMVECFRPIIEISNSSCTDFGHDCPAFYLTEFVNEKMTKKPPLDPKLIKLVDDIKLYPWFNGGEIIDEKPEKPCYRLGWCPYGSLGSEFKVRSTENKFQCKIFDQNCPVFNHFEFAFG